MKKAVTRLVRIDRVPRIGSASWSTSSSVCWLMPRMLTSVLIASIGISHPWTSSPRGTGDSTAAVTSATTAATSPAMASRWPAVVAWVRPRTGMAVM